MNEKMRMIINQGSIEWPANRTLQELQAWCNQVHGAFVHSNQDNEHPILYSQCKSYLLLVKK